MDKIFENEFLGNARVGTKPFRCHYIPFAKGDAPRYVRGVIDKTSSSEVLLLNGEWAFKAHEKYQDMVDINEPLPDRIPVPSCVQCHGYDHIQYLNVAYPFPFHPPYIDIDDPLFHCRRTVHIEEKGHYEFVFEGVDNAFYLFVNGTKVGYSNIAHSKSEFDVSPFLKEGDNVIDVLVLKWSASSYFECQDKFRFSGIFRDVYLLRRPERHITDYRFITEKKGKDGIVVFRNLSEVTVEIAFRKIVENVEPGGEITFRIPDARFWTDEDPYLYPFVLSGEGEEIHERIGIREVSTKGGVFKINGKHVKLRGVNRHESNPKTGMTVTLEDTYQDLRLMKKLGVNAVRTSHYPDIPEFYDLCDVMGIYVLDEADLETHGASLVDGKYDPAHWRAFADDMENEEAVYNRQVSLFERDKNRTCVVIFSMGNESSFGDSFQKGLAYLHRTSDRPIHYEGVYNSTKEDDYYDPRFSFASRMYPSPENLKRDHFDNPRETRPIIMCEYSHAMGNSNGDLLDYWKLFDSSPRFAGAFVWEWCDHAVLVNGKLHYGGDDNDYPNDGNFCVDGLVTPFRKLKSNTLELSAIYHGKRDIAPLLDKTKDFVSPVSKAKVRFIGDDETGELKDVLVDGKPAFASGVRLNFLRAFLDNDAHERDTSFPRLRNAKRIVRNIRRDESSLEYEGVLFDAEPLLRFRVAYACKGNALEVKLSYVVLATNLLVPRVGIAFAKKRKSRKYTFFGYGPGEAYVDKRVHNEMGEFVATIGEELPNNLKPQECGSHYGSSYLKMDGLVVSADHPFSFSVLPNSKEELEQARHNYDLVDAGLAHFSLDVAMAGVGTGSCGPRLDERYWIPKQSENTFRIYF